MSDTVLPMHALGMEPRTTCVTTPLRLVHETVMPVNVPHDDTTAAPLATFFVLTGCGAAAAQPGARAAATAAAATTGPRT